MHIGPSDAEIFGLPLLKSLVHRPQREVKLVIFDAHECLEPALGLDPGAAIQRVMGPMWQYCRVHWMGNALSYVPKAQQSIASAAFR